MDSSDRQQIREDPFQLVQSPVPDPLTSHPLKGNYVSMHKTCSFRLRLDKMGPSSLAFAQPNSNGDVDEFFSR